MKSAYIASLSLAGALLVGCGPSVSSGGGDDTGGDDEAGPDASSCVPSGAEVCTGAFDEDCDGYYDCTDVDCYGVGSCPNGNPNDNCGSLDLTEGQPLALPDSNTIQSHPACTPVTSYPQYTSSINFTGFTDGQVLEAATDILGICVNMEHSYVKDLQIEMQCPSGASVVLNEFLAPTGPKLLLGVPNEADGVTPVPGTGYDYCWTNTATQTMPTYPAGGLGVTTIPAGDYASSCPIATLEGCPLNGDWTIKVTDMYSIDNGFIFAWGINFDPNIVEDCEDWPVD